MRSLYVGTLTTFSGLHQTEFARVYENDGSYLGLYTWDAETESWEPSGIDDDGLGDVLAVPTDAALALLRGPSDGAQARTTGATVINAGDGDTWNWDDDYSSAADADHLKPGPGDGAWVRDTSNGSGDAWFDVPLDEDAFTTDLEDNVTPYYDATEGVWKTRPLPGDLPVINLADYLAVNGGNGVVDDTAAVNAWIAALVDPVTRIARGIGYLPLATSFFRITSTVTFQNIKGLRIFYAAAGGSEFRWHGTAGQPMFVIDGCENCHFAGMYPRNGGANPSHIFHVIERSDPSYWETNFCSWEDNYLVSGGVQCTNLWKFDTDCGEHYLTACDGGGYTFSGVYISAGARVHMRRFRAGGIYSAGAYGVYCDGGSFSCDAAAGGGGFNAVDFWIKSNDMACDITAHNTEESVRWIDVGDPSAPTDSPSGPPISVYGKRFDGGQALHADGRGIRLFSSTPFHIEGAGLSCLRSPNVGTLPPRIYLGTPSARSISLGQCAWNNFSGLGYSATRAASGVGTYYQSVLEWPTTWTEPPIVASSAYQLCAIVGSSGGVSEQIAFPARIVLASFGKGTAVRGSHSMEATTVSAGIGTTLTVTYSTMGLWPSNEVDTNFEPIIGIRVTAGAPVGALLAHVTAMDTGTISLKFNQSITGITFRLSIIFARMS